MKQSNLQGTVYYVVSFFPFGLQLPQAFPEVVHECRDPRVSVAFGALPRLMRKYGYGRYALLAVPASGPRKHVVTLTFADPAEETIERTRHSCPQCQACRKALREAERERAMPGRIEQAWAELAEKRRVLEQMQAELGELSAKHSRTVH